MFQAAGLTQPPRTMEEYTTCAEKLTQRDASGRPTVAGWSLRLSGGGQGVAEKFWTNMHQYGGAIVRQTAPGKWASAYANEAGRKTLGQYLDLVHTKRVAQLDSPADAEAFQRGQAAMFIRESWVIGDAAKKAPDLKYATTPLPVGTIVAPVFFYTPARGPRTELAWAYALAANEPDNLTWLLDNVGWLPNRRDVDYAPIIAKTPPLGAFVSLPAGHMLFEVPAIAPADEILTRLAARLVRAYGTARLDGATGLQAFRHITVPSLRPIILYVSVITLVAGFNVYAQVFVLASDTQGAPGRLVRVLVLDMLENAFCNYRVGYAASEAVVLLLVVLTLTAIQFRLLRTRA